MYSSISAQSKAEVETFGSEITLPNGSTFNHRETVEQIGYHKLGQFYSSDDADAVFYPLGQKRAPHFAKKIDADTKDYTLTAQGDNFNSSWVANIKLKRWMKDSGFALDLNDLAEACADYGSAVLKRSPGIETKNDYNICNLLNLWFDPSVDCISDSPINELHKLTEMQIRAMKGWDNIKEAIEKAEKVYLDEGAGLTPMVINKYKIWERFGEFQKKYKNGKYKDKEPKYYHTIFCGYGNDEVILFEEEIKKEDCPYLDFHLSKYEDRWLRVGVYERLFGLQQLVNELVNYNRQANAIASLLLLLSKDKSLMGRNVLQEAFSGMILDANSITQVPIDNRFLSGFLAELMRYEIKADELCMTPEVITGEQLPSGATFRGQAVLTNVANDAFKNARDRIHTRMADALMRDIIPDLMKKWNTEDVLEIGANEEDAQMFDYYAMKAKVNDFISEAWKQGKNPSVEEIAKFKEEMATKWQMEGRKATGLKGFFKFKYSLSFNPTGENVNKEQKNDAFNNALQMLIQYPPFAMNPMFKEYLEYNGISPIKIPMAEINAMMQASQQQGAFGGAPQPAKQDKLLSMVNN